MESLKGMSTTMMEIAMKNEISIGNSRGKVESRKNAIQTEISLEEGVSQWTNVSNVSGSRLRRSRQFEDSEQSEISPSSKSVFRKERKRTLSLSKNKRGIQQKRFGTDEKKKINWIILIATTFLIIFYFCRRSSKIAAEDEESVKIIPNLSFEDILELPFERRSKNAPTCNEILDSPYQMSPGDIQFTLVTQLSHDRLWMLNHHCQRWGSKLKHPISVAIFTKLSVNEIRNQIEASMDHCDINFMAIQIISSENIARSNYPVNALRNLAISGVKTSHIFYADIDFFEAPSIYDILHSASSREQFAKDNKFAAVIPALAYKRACDDEYDCLEQNLKLMPKTSKEVFEKLLKVDVFPFDPFNRGGHGSTSLWAWCDQENGTFFNIPCFKSNRYEPYLAFRYCDFFPPFQEKFTGYGKNKMTQVMHMRHVGYNFAQLGGAFLIHYPHKDSGSRLEWDKTPLELQFDRNANTMRKARDEGRFNDINFTSYKRGQIDQLFVQFRSWLQNEVEDNSRVSLCENSMDDDAKLWVLNPKI